MAGILLPAFLSAFLQVVFENVIKAALEEFELETSLANEVKKLMDSLRIIEAFLKDAEEKQQTDNAVKIWLEQLRDLAYDANDLLDEFATEAQRRRLIRFSKLRNSLSPINPRRSLLRHDISLNIKDLSQRLDAIEKRQSTFHLKVKNNRARDQDQDRRDLMQTTSLGSSSFDPLGRENDKRNVINLLVVTAGEISVIPLLGMGGIGKTTLAQIVYNDETIQNHFDLRLWIHVSRNFDVSKITKSIIEAIDCAAFDSVSLDNLHQNLRRRLSGRRYLLVLDDFWSGNQHEWETLRAPLQFGAKGSKILVTTRIVEVAQLVCTVQHPYSLTGLSDDNIWSLFCQNALGPNSAYRSSDLIHIAHEVVNRCRGLPLAAVAIGFGLRREPDRSQWGSIVSEEICEFSGGDSNLTSSVQLSYQHLPPDLKPCFAYCAIIPKGHGFNREYMVQLWMAQNFLRPGRSGEQPEDVGCRYFDALVQLSFFKHSHIDYKRNQQVYTMHSITHDFARLVSGMECCIVENRGQAGGQTGSRSISEKARHCTLLYGPSRTMGSRPSSSSYSSSSRHSSTSTMFERVYGFKGLYTLLAISGGSVSGMEIPENLTNNLKSLRALDLSDSGVWRIPESIGQLRHLRYLQLRNTNIRRLPESLGCLYNLQTLGLANCYLLEELPRDTSHLRKLRHLDLSLDNDDSRLVYLRSMPPNIGKLTSLQTLHRFVVGTEKRCGLSELRNLNDLCGNLRVSNLHLVMDATEAEDADFATKEYIHQLELCWGEARFGISVQEEVLRLLEPNTNLKQLKLLGYSGASFPAWFGQCTFTNLVTVVLSDCKKCTALPPLGQLPSLKELSVQGMDRVVFVDCAFCGSGGGGGRAKFPALEKLSFKRMPRFQVWCGDETCALPHLRELVFKDCVDLRQLTHKFPSLGKLVIQGSPWLLGLPSFPSLRSLDVRTRGEWVWDSVTRLRSLSSLSIGQSMIVSVPSGQRRLAASLRWLEISDCGQLVRLPDDWLPAGLAYFTVRRCPQLRSLPRGMSNLGGLEDMEIDGCMQLQALPDQLPRGLQFLSIDNCPELSQRCRGQDYNKIAQIPSVWIDRQPLVSPHSQSGSCER